LTPFRGARAASRVKQWERLRSLLGEALTNRVPVQYVAVA